MYSKLKKKMNVQFDGLEPIGWNEHGINLPLSRVQGQPKVSWNLVPGNQIYYTLIMWDIDAPFPAPRIVLPLICIG